jgi:hypothetical protein
MAEKFFECFFGRQKRESDVVCSGALAKAASVGGDDPGGLHQFHAVQNIGIFVARGGLVKESLGKAESWEAVHGPFW